MRLPGNRRRTRRSRSQEANESNRPGVNLTWLAIVILVFAVLPYFLKDAQGFPYKFHGTYFWLMGLVISFIAGVYYFAQFLLPLPWQYSWYEGVRLTIRHNFPFFTEFVRSFFMRPKNLGATPEALKDLPPSFTRHKAGIIRSHQAPVIFKGASFSRGAKPGFLRLKQGEIVVQVVDLRNHFRTQSVKVLTRDGIPLDSGVSTIFQVKRMADPPDDNWQFPFDQDAIFKVNFLGTFNTETEDNKVLAWTDRVTRQAASALIGEVSRYSLDELFELDESRAAPLEIIKERITKRVTKAFEKYGIEVSFVGVMPFQAPEEVQQERIKIWQTKWQQRIGVQLGTAESERTRRLKLARARAQIEMIERLTDGLESIRQSGQDVTEILSLRLIEAIEEAEENASVRALIPAQIVNDLKSIRSQVLGNKDQQ